MNEGVTTARGAGSDDVGCERSANPLDQRIGGYMDQIPNPIVSVKRLGAVITAGILKWMGSMPLRALDYTLASSS